MEKVLQGFVVVVEVGIEFIDPLCTLIVSLLQSDDAKRIHVARLIDIDSTINTAQPLAILTDDVSNLQTRNIEVLRGRIEDHGIVGTRF